MPLDWPVLSSTPSKAELATLSGIIKQNSIQWLECASKVSIFIIEAEQCID